MMPKNTLCMFAYNLLFSVFNHSYHHTCSMLAKHLDNQQTTQMEQCHSPMRNLFKFNPMKCVSTGVQWTELSSSITIAFVIFIELEKYASISVNANCKVQHHTIMNYLSHSVVHCFELLQRQLRIAHTQIKHIYRGKGNCATA